LIFRQVSVHCLKKQNSYAASELAKSN